MYGFGGKNGAVSSLGQVEIGLIPNESGVFLRNILIDNFYQNGYPASPQYALNVSNIKEEKIDLDVTVDSESTRRQIKIFATITLNDFKNPQNILTRSLVAITSYNVLESQFTTRVSEQDAREAALNDLARQIENQVVLYLSK
jgi:LPS-assembly lipoprotein